MRTEDLIGFTCGKPTRYHPHKVCREFYDAVKSGEMIPNTVKGGWHFKGMPKRNMSARAHYAAQTTGTPYVDHSGEMYLLAEKCPFCAGILPDVVVQTVPTDDEGEE